MATITRLKHWQRKFTIFTPMFTFNQSSKRFQSLQMVETLLVKGLILALLFSIVPAASASSGQSQNNDKGLPVFSINKTEHNFGEVFVGEDLAVSFTVRNLGAAPLQLADSPIVTGKPTIGVYREPLRREKFSLKELLAPAARLKSAAPYT